MNASRFSLIIPTYNEAGNIVALLDDVRAVLSNRSYEIIIVDDHSPDGTAALAASYARTHPEARVIDRERERGLSSAVIRGFDVATGDILGVMDGDRSHDVAILPAMIQAIESGAEMVVGSRRVPGGGADKWPWYRRLTSDIATRITQWLVGTHLSDPMSGYFCLRRPLYESCKNRLQPEGYKILLELYCKGRPATVREIPFIFRDRTVGHSKLTPTVAWQFLHMVAQLIKTR